MKANIRLENEWDWQVPVRKELFKSDYVSFIIDEKMPDAISVILKRQNNTYECHINKRLHPLYLKLSCFLGLSVNILDLRENESLIFYSNRENFYNSSYKQKIAMSFALDLLIPKDAINYFTMKKNITCIKELSEIFQCSENHLIIQLEEKGFLSNKKDYFNVY